MCGCSVSIIRKKNCDEVCCLNIVEKRKREFVSVKFEQLTYTESNKTQINGERKRVGAEVKSLSGVDKCLV